MVELYADDTTAYCIGDNMDVVNQQFNLIFLAQIYKWSQRNKPSIHSGKNEAILFQRVLSLAPLQDLNYNNNRMEVLYTPPLALASKFTASCLGLIISINYARITQKKLGAMKILSRLPSEIT